MIKGPTAPPARLRLIAELTAWVAALAVGFGYLASYQARAGEAAKAPDAWPQASGLPAAEHHRRLVMFAHPKCPCSEASLEELKIILTQAGDELSATICFVVPEGLGAEWADTELHRAARAIPGLQVVVDRGGLIARQFGAMTSGQVFVFDERGARLFSGGITGARGHGGINRGRSLVIALALGQSQEPAHTAVFGCALHDAAAPGTEAALR